MENQKVDQQRRNSCKLQGGKYIDTWQCLQTWLFLVCNHKEETTCPKDIAKLTQKGFELVENYARQWGACNQIVSPRDSLSIQIKLWSDNWILLVAKEYKVNEE